MRFDILTIFPEFFSGPFDYGILKRARTTGRVEIAMHDLRSFTHDRHRTVDDRPFGGGEGMVLKVQPIYDAIQSLQLAPKQDRVQKKETVILLSAQGRPFSQSLAQELAATEQFYKSTYHQPGIVNAALVPKLAGLCNMDLLVSASSRRAARAANPYLLA